MTPIKKSNENLKTKTITFFNSLFILLRKIKFASVAKKTLPKKRGLSWNSFPHSTRKVLPSTGDLMYLERGLVGHPEPAKNSVGIFEYNLAFMLKVYLDVF